MDVTASPITTDPRLAQAENALIPMDVTASPITTDARLAQAENT